MADTAAAPIEVLIVAVPETAGSALYGMLDVLHAAGLRSLGPVTSDRSCTCPPGSCGIR